MKKILLSVLLTLCCTMAAWAQGTTEKLSVPTRIFLSEFKEGRAPAASNLKNKTIEQTEEDAHRIYAAPELHDGKLCISAFVRVENAAVMSQLEQMGVVVQQDFVNGTLFTTLIPVDIIEAVAEVDGVKGIEIAQQLETATSVARTKTNTDDVLTLSADAQSAGITSKYTGKGVLVGVIDEGIDFKHKAFTDVNGTTRIVRAYVHNGSTETYYTHDQLVSSPPTTDDSSTAHGTHVAGIAGGSTVQVSSSSVTVKDPSATSSATPGGMAPESSLYLAGLNSITTTRQANAMKDIIKYADENNMPVVVNCSWGSHYGPHDGTGLVAEDIFNSYFGDDHPNHIAVVATGNQAGLSSEGGGMHLHGTVSTTAKLGSVARNSGSGNSYSGIVASAWTRTEGDYDLRCNIYVINNSTGAIAASAEGIVPTTAGVTVSGFSECYSGTLKVIKNYSKGHGRTDFTSSGKTQVMIYASSVATESSGKYSLAFEFYTGSGSVEIDVWGGTSTYYRNLKTTSGHTWTNGDDDMTVTDVATAENIISVGAYNSYLKSSWGLSGTINDIAYYSGYGTPDQSPTGLQYPTVTAPGRYLLSAINSNYSGLSSSMKYDSPSSSPYGYNAGTSMACPVVTGIVALWLQAAMENDISLTNNDVKNIIAETAIRDSYVTGTNAKKFGNGKIDALAGLAYLLTKPAITATPQTLEVESNVGESITRSIALSGEAIKGNVTVTLNDENDVFSITPTTFSAADVLAGNAVVNVTFTPQSLQTYNATLTIANASLDENVVVNLVGTGKVVMPEIVATPSTLSFSTAPGLSTKKTFNVSGTGLKGDITATLNDPSNVFSISTTTIDKATASQENGTTITVTFNPDADGSFTGTVTLTSEGADPVMVNLNATAESGGTASDAYLNIARHETIKTAGWSTSVVTNLYKYTEYESQGVAWLTLPIYGAYNSTATQKWIENGISGSMTTNASWKNSAQDIFFGQEGYFTTQTNVSVGLSSSSSKIQKSVSFYVTNTTASKLLIRGRNGAREGYPIALEAYECTTGSNGTLTVSTTATKSATSIETTFTYKILSINDLDADKIYCIKASFYGGDLCEIGFETPLVAPEYTLKEIVNGNEVNEGDKVNIVDGDLTAIYLAADGMTLYCKDNNAYTPRAVAQDGMKDFVVDVAELMSNDYDQSNWVALKLESGEFAASLIGHTLTGVKGTLTAKTNPVVTVSAVPVAGAATSTYPQNLNVFLPCSFDAQFLLNGSSEYFFMTPKPMEVMNVKNAQWDESQGKFMTATSIISIASAGFFANFSLYSGTQPTLANGHEYNFTAVAMRENATATVTKSAKAASLSQLGIVVYPLEGFEELPTAVGNINASMVKAVRYYNLQGIESSTPFTGINIVVKEMTDGSKTVTKVLK